jgi:multiple RNA-binding domain-containing protein 1
MQSSIFQGRVLHVIAAQPARTDSATVAVIEGKGTYKQQQDAKRRKEAEDQRSWNATYVSADAAANAISERLQKSKSELLDAEDGGSAGRGSMAVRMAVMETYVTTENQEALEKEGVDLEQLNQEIGSRHADKKGGKDAKAAKAKAAPKRSDTVILIKNLPASSDEQELNQLFGKHGDIVRLVLPPSKTLALIEFADSMAARKALRSLAYRKYQHAPLYLEWAPAAIFKRPAVGAKSTSASAQTSSRSLIPTADDESSATGVGNTLHIKNISFDTSDQALLAALRGALNGKYLKGRKAGAGGEVVRTAKVVRRKDNVSLSSGFGFCEFSNAEAAQAAVKVLQGTTVNGHALQFSVSKTVAVHRDESGRSAGGSLKPKDQCTKLVVRNVAFEATGAELRELFAAFGQVKNVRMPRKFAGGHRGFAFVEFLTKQECENAMKALSSTHLYGRHLVIEWANAKDEVDELRTKAARDIRSNPNADRAAKRKKLTDKNFLTKNTGKEDDEMAEDEEFG